MKLRLSGGICALAILMSGCSGQPSSEPPVEIAQACVSTNFGSDVLYAPEWVKPLIHTAGRATWAPEESGRIIFRSETPNPLNGETKTVSVLFAPAAQPVKTAPFCQGYYEPVLVDVDGIEQPVAALRQQMAFMHMMGLGHYGGQVPEGPLTLEYNQ